MTRLLTFAAALALISSTLHASVAVTNYNWLQLPPADEGGDVGGGSGNDSPIDYRWGDWAWIPNSTLTNSGADSYWAAVRLDQSRNIKKVSVQFWLGEGTSVTAFHIDGSNDGTGWTNDIGSYNFGSAQSTARTGLLGASALTLTNPGNYQYVRVRFEPGEYAYGSAARGGPGLIALEPIGDGTLADNQVNWLNKSNFGTTVSNSNLAFSGTRYNDGFLYDDEGVRTGDQGTWASNQYMQMNLGAPRTINQLIGVWDSGWHGTGFDVQYSPDGGATYLSVTNKAATNYATEPGAKGYVFDDATSQYWRIASGTGGTPWTLFNQVLMFSPTPEPSGLALLALAALTTLRRRRI